MKDCDVTKKAGAKKEKLTKSLTKVRRKCGAKVMFDCVCQTEGMGNRQNWALNVRRRE